MLLGLYLLTSLPGLIAAFAVRAWGIRHGWDRTSRAAWFALTIGLFCSPGIYVAESMIPAFAVTPSLLAVGLNYDKGREWMIFFVSGAFTSVLTFVTYVLASKAKAGGDGAEE